MLRMHVYSTLEFLRLCTTIYKFMLTLTLNEGNIMSRCINGHGKSSSSRKSAGAAKSILARAYVRVHYC